MNARLQLLKYVDIDSWYVDFDNDHVFTGRWCVIEGELSFEVEETRKRFWSRKSYTLRYFMPEERFRIVYDNACVV